MLFIKNPLGVYEKALAPQPWPSFFDTAVRAGFDFAEISLDDSPKRLSRLDWDGAECRQLTQTARDAGLRLFAACLSGHKRYPLGSMDKTIARQAKEMLHKATIFCAETGIRVLQLAGCDVFYEPSTAETIRRFYDNLGEGLSDAERYGVMYAIEPLEHAWLCDVSHCLEVVRYFNSPWLKVYPDVANMAGMGIDPILELEKGFHDSVAVHLREALPDFFLNVPFGSGIVDFDGIFARLAALGWKRPLVIEMWNESDPDYFSLINRERDFIEKKLKKAGLR